MKKSLYIFLLLISLSLWNATGQDTVSITAHARVLADRIQLRWAAGSPSSWRYTNREGFAFTSSRSLYLAIGHELVHVHQYAYYLAGHTASFLNSAIPVMEVGAYSWEVSAGNSLSKGSVIGWRGHENYGRFFTPENLNIANGLLYNSAKFLPTHIPHFGPIQVQPINHISLFKRMGF